MGSLRDMFLDNLVSKYGLKYETISSGGGLCTYHGVMIVGDETFLGFTKDSDIPFFDLFVDIRHGFSFEVIFHRYKCPGCSMTDPSDDPNMCCGIYDMEEIPAPKDIEFNFTTNPNNEEVSTKSASKKE